MQLFYESQFFVDFEPEWFERARATLEEFATDPDPTIQAIARDAEGTLHYAARRFEEAAAAFEASAERSTTWIGQQNIYLVGDCWLEAGRFSDALTSYVRAARHAYVRRDISTLSFQIEGAAASLAGLGRCEEAFRTLGLADTITPTERPLRDSYPAWSGGSPRTWIRRGRRSAMPPPTQPTRRVARCRATERSRRSSRFRSKPQSPDNGPASLLARSGHPLSA